MQGPSATSFTFLPLSTVGHRKVPIIPNHHEPSRIPSYSTIKNSIKASKFLTKSCNLCLAPHITSCSLGFSPRPTLFARYPLLCIPAEICCYHGKNGCLQIIATVVCHLCTTAVACRHSKRWVAFCSRLRAILPSMSPLQASIRYSHSFAAACSHSDYLYDTDTKHDTHDIYDTDQHRKHSLEYSAPSRFRPSWVVFRDVCSLRAS
jgi:hypothetical protein